MINESETYSEDSIKKKKLYNTKKKKINKGKRI